MKGHQVKPNNFSLGQWTRLLRVGLWCSLGIIALLAGTAGLTYAAGSVYQVDFKKLVALPASWKIQGQVTISAAGGFGGGRCLTIARTKARHFQAAGIVLAPFPVRAGRWRIQGAMKSDLVSPDSSYDGELSLQVLNKAGAVVKTAVVGTISGRKAWHLFRKTVELPTGSATARFAAAMHKTWGRFSLDALAARYTPSYPAATSTVKSMAFACKAPGALFFPKEAVRFVITVKTIAPLLQAHPHVLCQLTDYWGAAFSQPISVPLRVAIQSQARAAGPQTYSGTLNLSQAELPRALQIGKYYQIHAILPEHGVLQPYRTYWAFAILPHAAANKYSPFAIPFTQRNWDGRIPEDIILSHRLGVRICDLWSGWNSTPPYSSWAPGIHLLKKLHMGALLGAESGAVEGQDGQFGPWTAKALRVGAEKLVNKYKNYIPIAVDLGNEPHPTSDAAARGMIAAYKAVYQGVKAADPKVLVIGTSCGPTDIFFRNGFQKYLDAYDYHDYGNSNDVPQSFAAYHKLFHKYGDPKPIWSTETGLNAGGLTISRIARTMVRKFALFFANGGANISWFDLLYPNGGGKHMRGASFNVFHIRYGNYCPKMTAVDYYNVINYIAIKKCVASKIYPRHIHDVLFRDAGNHCLQILWRTSGRQAQFVPLPGATAVKVIHIDGSVDRLNAHGEGVTLNIAAFPLMLLYTSPQSALPAAMGPPAMALAATPAPIVKGGHTTIRLRLHGVPADDITVTPPPFWSVKPANAVGAWILTAPVHTSARQARIVATLKNGQGELYFGIPITGQLTAQLLPTAKTSRTAAGLKLIVHNNDSTKQTYLWHVSIKRQYPMVHGGFNFTHHVSVSAYFGAINSGRISVPAGATAHIALPVDGLTPQTIYRIQATVRTASGQMVTVRRVMSGFVGVPYVGHAIPLDGKLTAAAWAKCMALHINKANQFFAFARTRHWHGPKDLSGTVRFLWSKKYLYVGVKVTDRLFWNHASGENLWQGDGLQFLVDPVRAAAAKIGYYDYSMAVGSKGPQAWCNSSADSRAPVGNAKSIIVTAHRLNKTTGDMTYVLAIPWSRLAPFKPASGADLGLSIILNDANTHGRNCYMGWYAGVSNKQIKHVGDLILMK